MTRANELKTLTDRELETLEQTLHETSRVADDAMTWSDNGQATREELYLVHAEKWRRHAERVKEQK